MKGLESFDEFIVDSCGTEASRMSNIVIGPISISEPITTCGLIIKALGNVMMLSE